MRLRQLNELFDSKPSSLSVEDEGHEPIYSFSVNGSVIEVVFSNLGDGKWMMLFERDGSTAVTGGGNASEILGGVISVIQRFIQNHEVKDLSFSAAKGAIFDGDEVSSGRTKLYSRMLQKFANQAGYKFTVTSGKFDDIFTIHVTDNVSEDVESDTDINEILNGLVDKAVRSLSDQYHEPTWNADRAIVNYKGKSALIATGRQLGWEPPFDNARLIIGFSRTSEASYSSPKANNLKAPIIFVNGFYNENFDDDPDWFGRAKLVFNSHETRDALFHELVHMYQDLVQEVPSGTEHTSTGNLSGDAYFNSPKEFDARFRVIANDYVKAIRLAQRMDLESVLDVFGIDKDFRTYIDRLQKTGKFKMAGGVLWSKGTPERIKRMIQRLYQLHQKLMNVQQVEETTMTEASAEEQHAAALKATGYWGNAGAGCLIMAMDTGRILIPLRSEWVQEPGTWGTWGGAIDGDEDPKTACMREVEEEAGYDGPVRDMIHLYRFEDNGFRYDTFLAIVDSEFEPQLNWETERAEWVEVGQWPSPLHFGLADVLKDKGVQNKLGSAAS